MSSITLNYDPSKSRSENAITLSIELKKARAENNTRGFRFLFSKDEHAAHAKTDSRFNASCSEFMRMIDDEKKTLRIFVNLNHEVAVEAI